MDSLDKLAAEVFAILGEAGIPAEIIGGYALSHYGYVRNTTDIDVVVGGDYLKALQLLKDHGFVEAERGFKLKDPSIPDKRVDVLPAGKHMSGCPVPNPEPIQVSSHPEFTKLQNLLAMKIGVLFVPGAGLATHSKNEADIYYLIQNNDLPRTLMDGYPIQDVMLQYQIMWDDLTASKGKTSSLDESYDPFEDFLNK